MSIYFDTDDVQLHHGDALAIARTLPDGMARTIITSPPYFGLRDYGADGQYGAEGSVGEYVSRMVELFRELRRVLADDGTLWLNLGDSYSASVSSTGGYSDKSTLSVYTSENTKHRRENGKKGRRLERTVPAKNLLGVPWRVAFALQEDGWILRSDIIWAKPNPMPESVTDRPTKAHEYLFLFSKSPRYYYDAAAISEGAAYDGPPKPGKSAQTAYTGIAPHSGNLGVAGDTRNKRSVWTVPTVPFPGSHFAVYPPDLIRPCIRAGSEPGDVVLDPFSGSGTTGAVATFEGRRYVGIDLNSDYLEMSLQTRFQQPTLSWGELA